MTNLLRKLFIKNFNNVEDPKVRQKHGFLSSFVGIFTNFLLFAFKLVIGLLIFSMSIISDAINNLTDMASCIVNLVGFKLAGKPADKEHPFGHERIEYIAGLIISFIIIAIACVLGYTSVMKIVNNEITKYDNPTTTIATFVILVVAILAKLWQGLFYKKMGKAINSVSLKASSQDSINDVISTSAVLVATIIEYLLRDKGIQIDGWMGIVVAVFIIIMGIKTAIETSNPLIGITPDTELVKKVKEDILAYPGVIGLHDIMCHSYGPTKIFMTIHVEVDYKVDVMVSHDLIDNIESEISNKYNILLTIHMDPIVTDSPKVNELKEFTKDLLSKYEGKITFHDFRIVKGPTHTNVLFDIVVPYDLEVEDKDIINYLRSEYEKRQSKYFIIVKVDREYVE